MHGFLLVFYSDVVPTRSSADADNRLDAFSGQSRSTNIVPFHNVTYSFLWYNSNLSLRQVSYVYAIAL